MAHLKALASQKALKGPRKEKVWILAPAPGPHAAKDSVPLGVIIRDYLGLSVTKKETKYLLNNNVVTVDCRRVKDINFPIGLFDLISIEKIEKSYMMMVDHRGRLFPKEIPKSKATENICKLVGKTVIKGGRIQLNFYDGKNILVDAKDSHKYTVGGTAVIKVPELKIVEFIAPGVGKIALVSQGRHASKVGKIVAVTKGGLNLKSLTTIDVDGEKVTTNTNYIFIVGDKTSKI